MTAEVVRLPRRHVFRLAERFLLYVGNERRRAIELELRQNIEAVRILNQRRAALYVAFRQEIKAQVEREAAEREAQS
jgi:hypothetical protein